MAIPESPFTEVGGTYRLIADGRRYLRARLEEAGKMVTALALELGISRKHLSNALNGRVPLMEPLIDLLARAAGTMSRPSGFSATTTGRWARPATARCAGP